MHIHQDRPASSRQWLRRHDILNFITTLYEGDLHAKRVLSLANATQGVLTSASLAIHAVGRGLAQAMGTLTKHGVKQVDRLLSNRGVDVWAFFAYWTPFIVAARTEVVVALDWTSFAADGQDTIVLSMVTLNQGVAGSIPARPTNNSITYEGAGRGIHLAEGPNRVQHWPAFTVSRPTGRVLRPLRGPESVSVNLRSAGTATTRVSAAPAATIPRRTTTQGSSGLCNRIA